MDNRFQQIIDGTLRGIPRQSVNDQPHFVPLGETEHEKEIMAALATRRLPEIPGYHVHVGVGGGFNLSVAAKTRPDRILFLDMNRAQEQLWKQVITLLKENDSPASFLRAFAKQQRRHRINYLTGADYKDYPQSADWVQPDAYAYLHRMALEGNMAAATLDIVNDKEAAAAIGKTLRAHTMRADTCYWSNIATWFEPRARDSGAQISTQGDVFNTEAGGLVYEARAFYDKQLKDNQWTVQWDCANPPAIYSMGERGRECDVPMFESMLRNISAIGGDAQSFHMMTRATPRGKNAALIEGRPRNLARISYQESVGRRNPPTTDSADIKR